MSSEELLLQLIIPSKCPVSGDTTVPPPWPRAALLQATWPPICSTPGEFLLRFKWEMKIARRKTLSGKNDDDFSPRSNPRLPHATLDIFKSQFDGEAKNWWVWWWVWWVWCKKWMMMLMIDHSDAWCFLSKALEAIQDRTWLLLTNDKRRESGGLIQPRF